MNVKQSIGNAIGAVKLGGSKALGMTGLKIKERSPELLLGLGLITMAGAVVSGILAAKHHDEVMDDHFERIASAKAEYLYPEDYDPENPDCDVEPVKKTDKEISKQVRREYCRTAAAMCKLYVPTVSLMALSAACFIGMHNIQAGRIAGLSGAYTGLKEAFEQYQKRNIELNGEENHRMCKYGYKEIEVEEEDPDNGEKYTVKKKVPLEASEIAEKELEHGTFHDNFATYCRQTSTMYKGRGLYDIMDLDNAERYIQDIVNSRGWAIVNEARIGLGMAPTVEGMVEGWVRGGEPVSFGHHDPVNQKALDGFVDQPIELEFNVHGNVYTLLRRMEEKQLEERRRNLMDKKK